MMSELLNSGNGKHFTFFLLVAKALKAMDYIGVVMRPFGDSIRCLFLKTLVFKKLHLNFSSVRHPWP